MRLLHLAVLGVLSLASATPAAAQAFSLDSVRAVLPSGTLRVDAMDVAQSPRMAELTQKFQRSVQQHQEWYLEHVRKAVPGEPLAYDERLGLTRAEYDEFLRLARNVGLRKVAEGQLVVRAEGDRLVLDGGAGMPDLTGWVIDLAADRLVTPLATVTGSREAYSDGAGAAIGAYDGRTWKHQEMSADGRDGRVVSLLVGRMRESGRGVIYSQMHQVQGGRPTARTVRILFYDVPR